MFVLESERLRVEIAEPGESPCIGYRFDRAAFISEVTLDGAVHFTANEPSNLAHPSTKGRGLCVEFTADFSSEAAEGEYYPKLGVGLIKKDGPYCFYKSYPDTLLYPVRVTHGKQMAHFLTEPIPCLGIAVQTARTVTVSGNRLCVETMMKNVGEREINTDEYCHNFLSIDGMAISPDYQLELLGLHGLSGGELVNEYPTPSNFRVEREEISILRSETAVSLAVLPMTGLRAEQPFRWRLSHRGAGAWVEGEDEIHVSGITLWAADHIFSPEILQTIRFAPGECLSWRRSLTFGRETKFC